MFFFQRKRVRNDSFEEKLSSLGRTLQLPEDVRLRAKANLFRMMRETKRIPHLPVRAESTRFVIRFAGALAIIVLLLTTTFTGIARADDSKPGDTLFSIDKLIEEIELFFTKNPEAKLKLSIAIASERLGELEELSLKITSSSETAVQTTNFIATQFVSTSTSTSTPTTTPTTATSTSTTTPPHATSTSARTPLEKAIEQALKEVEGALAKVHDTTAQLTVKANKGGTISPETTSAFLEQVGALTTREDIIIKKLKLKVRDTKLELKVKIFEPTLAPPTSTPTTTTVRPHVTICHNLGNGDMRTVTIPHRALGSHQAHGDSIGACDEKEKRRGRGEGRDNDDDEHPPATSTSPTTIPTTTASNDDDDDEDEEEREERRSKVKVRGIIESVGENEIVIFGTRVRYTGETDIDFKKKHESLSVFEVGRWAEVEGTKGGDGTVVARKIKVK